MNAGRKPIPQRSGAHLYYSALRTGTCRQCSAPISRCTHDGKTLELDAISLTQLGEVDALIQGISTFHVVFGRAFRRHRLALASQPVVRWGDIRPAHRCRRTIPAAHVAPPVARTVFDICPF